MMLAGKVVIVTGVGPGMGRKLCVGAAAEGALVVMGARSKDFLAQVRDEITAAGGQCAARGTDVSEAEDCDALAAEALRQFGRIDGLVNSAYYH
ncbi:MAG TPA: SDR family NAD(P)-dependent oxidoreductase, partial [Acetobacteraceae bacterium]|nr:SDR family NAD(P)-dependent oxidoreductase [Acetobacteraceae bacterium]